MIRITITTPTPARMIKIVVGSIGNPVVVMVVVVVVIGGLIITITESVALSQSSESILSYMTNGLS